MTKTLETIRYDMPFITKMKILDATDRLMRTTLLDKLTVRDICEEANVSRATFYRHFRDKYDISQWYWNFFAEQSLKKTGITLDWYECNLMMLQGFRERFTFFLNSFRSETYNSCREHGYRCRIAFLRETIASYYGMDLTDELEFEIKFFVEAESRAVVDWLREGMPCPAETIAHYIEGCVPPKLYRVFDGVIKKRPIAAAETPYA